jgi:hypothetical protein
MILLDIKIDVTTFVLLVVIWFYDAGGYNIIVIIRISSGLLLQSGIG